MALTGNALLLRQIMATSVFKLFSLVFAGIQRLYWELSGTGSQLRSARRPENYDRCAQVLDVVCAQKFDMFVLFSMSDFVCTHRGFVSPQYVIDNEHVSLMFIDDQSAVFSEAEEKDMRLWRSDYNSFIRLAQLKYTKRLIRVPLAAFHRMSETIGDPRAHIVFLFKTSRSGSTLLTQVMEYTERCISLSEPDSSNTIATRYQRDGDSPELRQLARDVIRWECRPYPSMEPQPLAYIIKFTAASVSGLPLFKSVFPQAKFLFMYRSDVVAMAKSVYRVSQVVPSARIVCILGRLSGLIVQQLVNSMGFSGKSCRIRLDNDLMLGTFITCLVCSLYNEIHCKDPSIRALRYEDLVANPVEVCRVLMEYCELPSSLATLAVRGMDVDSQRNSPLARSVVGRLKEPRITEKVLRSLDDILSKFGLPLIGSEFLLDGTFTIAERHIPAA